MSYETILYEQSGGVLTITLNRPEKLNAINDAMLGELKSAFKAAGRDDSIRAVLLTGAGRGFCPGQDLYEARSRDESMGFGEHLRTAYNPFIRRLYSFSKPIVCAVNGVATGAGMSLALATDIRIASEDAYFMQAFVKVGLVPDTGSSKRLQDLIGQTRAMELMLTGHELSAQEALEWGLINQVVPHDDLMPTALELTERLAQGPTKVMGYIKRAVQFSVNASLEQALEYEADMQELAGRTEDSKEGIAAFIEKRDANFTGR